MSNRITGTLFGNNNNEEGENASSTEAEFVAANEAANAAEAANEAANEAAVAEEAAEEAVNAAEATFGTATTLTNATLGKKGKGKGTGKSRGPLSQAQKNKLKTGRNQAKTKKNATQAKARQLYGQLIYPGEKNTAGKQKEATDLDLKMLQDIANAMILKGEVPDLAKQIEMLKKLKTEMPAKRLKIGTKAERNNIRKTLRGFKIKPSITRVNAYYKGRNNFNKTYKREKYEKVLKEENAPLQKTLLNYFKEQGAKSPELVGTRKFKAEANERLAGAKNAAEASLLKIAKERTVKGVTKKSVNPATVKHLAELRLAGYKITPEEMVRLSSLVKKVKNPATKAALDNDPGIKLLVAQGKKLKKACDRCLMTTIFGQDMP
jgi:hypothetical protein